jgi:histidyl-tRNA synthetase
LRLAEVKSLEEVEGQFASPDVQEAAGKLRELMGHLEAFGIGDYCRFDVSIVRGLAYYTGPVWEVWDKRGEVRALFGGGRYDRLLKDLGAGDMPAVGFGAGDMTMRLLLESKGMLPEASPPCQYFVAVAEESLIAHALNQVRLLRQAGQSVVFALKRTSLKRQLAKAGNLGARYCIIFDDRFTTDGLVALKDMVSGEQELVRPEEVCREH